MAFDGLRVDDYSSADNIDVYCDGYVMRFDKTNDASTSLLGILDPDDLGNLWIESYENMNDGSNTYELGYDDKRTYEIIENTPARVRIRMVANWDRTSGSTDDYLANSTSVTIIYTIYPDRYTIDHTWEVSGAISLVWYDIGDLVGDTGNIANENSVYEDSGSESDCSDTTSYNSAKYLAFTSDEVNAMFVSLYDSIDSIQQDNHADGQLALWFEYDPTGAETLKFSTMYIIDSADRVSGKQYDSEALRIALGNQYKDYAIAALTIGTKVADLNYPDIIDSDCFAADGAWHVEPDSNKDAKWKWDRTRKRPNAVIHDWPFLSGTTPDSHLLDHLKLDDNASSSTLVAEVGNNATWRLVSDESERNTDTAGDSVEGVRNKALDTQGGISYIDMGLTGHGNSFYKKGSVLIKFKPQFAYDVEAWVLIWELNVGGNDEAIYLAYVYSSDTFLFGLDFGTAVTIDTPAYTSNVKLQQWHTILCSWDADRDFMSLILDGVVIGSKGGLDTPSESNPVSFTVGTDATITGNPADIIIDEIKTFSECILPFGSIFLGNGEINANVAESDVCFHWACEDEDAEIGGVTGSTGTGSFKNGGIYGSKYYDNNGNTDAMDFTVTDADIFDPRKGSFSCWFYLPSVVSWDFLFGFGATGDDWIDVVVNGDSKLHLGGKYNGGGEIAAITSTTLTSGKWHHMVARWADSNNGGYFSIELNGVLEDADPVTDTFEGSLSGTLYICGEEDNSSWIDVWLDQVTITKNPQTPQNWTAFGKPLWRPIGTN